MNPLSNNQTPEPLNFKQPTSRFDLQNPEFGERYQELEEMPQENYHPATKKALQRLFLILIAIGVSVGLVLSVGIIMLMQRAGLTGVPPVPIEQPK